MWGRDRLAARRYRELLPQEVTLQRRSDTVFIFGSGYSLNELTPTEWKHFADHDTFGFSGFVYQEWVRTDYHLIRSWAMDFHDKARLRQVAAAYAEQLKNNPNFANTILFLQREFSAEFSNTLTGDRLLPEDARVCRYRAAHRVDNMPTARWCDGIMRDLGTLATAVNIAYLLGWKRIVLAGVDLYDNRYFWGPAMGTLQFDEDGDYRRVAATNDRGIPWDQPHNTASIGIVDILRVWASRFASQAVELKVYNPRSLLAAVLPVYTGPVRPMLGHHEEAVAARRPR